MLIKAEPALFLISFPVCARSDRDYTVDEFCMAKKKHYENKKNSVRLCFCFSCHEAAAIIKVCADFTVQNP